MGFPNQLSIKFVQVMQLHALKKCLSQSFKGWIQIFVNLCVQTDAECNETWKLIK